ncbi:MAG: hypothetical protein JWM12_464 [Ilumatobacteraceae bacterium]|nr:hypothetical protein [Ilumatobacteraceae bacterium]
MSSQPFPPSGALASPAPSPSGAPAGKRNTVLLVLGIVLVVVGVVAGLLLINRASSSVADNAQQLARAPGGCTTSLQFDKTGEFLVFYESKGRVGELDGDCGGNDASFDSGSSDRPDVQLNLADPDDAPATIEDASGISYDAGGFTGEEIGKVRIDAPGLYQLTVEPADPSASYAIAIGKDPTSDEGPLKAIGVGILIAGVVLGVLLIAIGLRRRGGAEPLVTAVPGGTWSPTVQPTATWPTQPQQPPTYSPPGFGAPPPAPSGPPPFGPAPREQQPPNPSPFSPPPPPPPGRVD